jgi:hypothetical protein
VDDHAATRAVVDHGEQPKSATTVPFIARQSR